MVKVATGLTEARRFLQVTWRNEASGGYVDRISAELWGNGRRIEGYVHEVVGPGGGQHQAKCNVSVSGNIVELDYRPFSEFNEREGMYLGILRLRFKGRGYARVEREVEWKDVGDRFFKKMEATAEMVQLEPLPDYVCGPDTARLVSRAVRQRDGQGKFARRLKFVYGGVCCISRCAVDEVLEAAHIDPFSGRNSDHIQNGLLLRADLHSLLDSALLAIDPSTLVVHIAPWVRRSPDYKKLHGTKMNTPRHGDESYFPSPHALQRRWDEFVKKTSPRVASR